MKNYYEILDVEVTASIEQIKKAYRQKAVIYHPDKHFGDKYLTDKFIEVKEAYEILSDSNKREVYQVQYNSYFKKEEPTRKDTYKEEKPKEKEKQFFYDPHRPFYSNQERIVNETPQFNPKINHWGEKLQDNADFFKLPKNIGRIVSGYTTLTTEMYPSNKRRSFWASLFGLSNKPRKFAHINTFIGVNGFAELRCEGTRQNIVSSFELNFKDVTDMLHASIINKYNFSYSNTAFTFIWLNNNKLVSEVSDLYYSKEGNPEKWYTNYWLNVFAEKYWTVYLLDNMEKDLETKGFIEFCFYTKNDNGYVKIPYIQLGIGYIKFLLAKGDITYHFNEIKRVYRKGTELFIEHTNYEKKLLLFESGNKNGIPIMALSNRQYFFKAMELLLGYKFSE